MTTQEAPAPSPPSPHDSDDELAWPSRQLQWGNVAVTQSVWFAVIWCAAHGHGAWGVPLALAAVVWHLAVAAHQLSELLLVLWVLAVGFGCEALSLHLGHVAYASPAPLAGMPPSWILSLWGVFATSLNVTMRWLHSRLWLASVLGAIAGPTAFSSGVRMGAARFIDAHSALICLGLEWAVAMPLLVMAARWLDGWRRRRVAPASWSVA